MTFKLICAFCLICFISFGQTTNISGVINSYTKVNQLGTGACVDTLYLASSAGFAVDDTVLLVQMKGAVIDTTNTASFGTILNYNNAGNYEFGTIKSVSGNFIVLNSSLTRQYSASGFLQLVRVPHYDIVNISGLLTCPDWNGITGGILVFTANTSVSLNANIDVSGKGFTGGLRSLNNYTVNFLGFFCSRLSTRGGDKGEGISTVSLAHAAGRGANSCGGGGGNDVNTGAGGGGNAGDGGHGGNNFYAPPFLWGDKGKSLDHSATANKLFLGGGGGGGHQNNSVGTDGTDGGGVIIIRTPTLNGNGFNIISKGLDVTGTSTIDGAGGGGAGGSILFDIQNFNGTLNVNVNGGKGGNQVYIPQCHGNGGGGGGGAIKRTGVTVFPANVITSVVGGVKGIGQCNNTVNDAANGANGLVGDGFSIVSTPVLVADAGPDQTICWGTSVQLGVSPQSGLTYTWNNSAGAISNPVVSPITTTSYILTVVQVGVCSNSITDTVIVNVLPLPQAFFNYSVDCSGLLVSFNNVSIGNTSSVWNFGDGSTSVSSSPTHVYANTGSYNVTLIIQNTGGCTDTVITAIQLNLPVLPTAAFTVDTTSCSLLVNFYNNSLNSSGAFWYFGDGNTSNLINPIHTFLSPGTYLVTLISSNQCGSDTLTTSVDIDPVTLPVALFVIDTNTCSSSVEFTSNSVDANNFNWNFGNGNSSSLQNPIVNFASAGSYTIILIAGNNCGTDTMTNTLVLANFDPPNTAFITVVTPCDSNVVFTNQSTNSLSSYWDFGDGAFSSSENPLHYYAISGIYNVLLISTNECGIDSIILPVDLALIAPPVASFTYDLQPCSSEVIFINNSFNDVEWNWNFGDNSHSNLENPVHIFEYTGNYEIDLIVNQSSGCQDTASLSLFIDDAQAAGLFVPNAFTPNKDGKNDEFKLKSLLTCDNFNLKIFNRWGQQIFETNNIEFSWDGNYNGTEVPAGVYYYLLEGSKGTSQGTISLLR